MKTSKYRNIATNYNLLKKAIFFVGLATGNRVSEISACTRNTLHQANPKNPIIPVKPGFIYQNQRSGRHPPSIRLIPLKGSSNQLCPVKTLLTYVKRGDKAGSLFLNSKSNRPLKAFSISRLIIAIINEANPELSQNAQGLDLRRIASSLA